jgi:2-oxoglutarate ferredoxin oxidoreductase subunit beta
VNGSFVARSIDTEAQHLSDVLRRAAKHKGTAFMEVYQNCNVFNDGAFDSFREKDVRAERQVRCEHGKPLLFGTNNEKGLRINPKTLQLEVVKVGENGITVDDVLVHDETNSTLAWACSSPKSARLTTAWWPSNKPPPSASWAKAACKSC